MNTKLVEVEIVRNSIKSTQIMEFGADSERCDIKRALKQLARTCEWTKFRFGVGNLWSKWMY